MRTFFSRQKRIALELPHKLRTIIQELAAVVPAVFGNPEKSAIPVRVGSSPADVTEKNSNHPAKRVAGYILSAGFFLGTLVACSNSSSINTLSSEEVRDGWELIFNGETLEGWRGLNMDNVPADHWVVENGLLKKVARDSIPAGPDGERPGGADLLLDRPVNNFEIAFEWKVSPVANSGIKYNVSEELSATQNNPHSALGFEYQVLDDAEYPQIAENPSWATAGLYELVDPGSNALLNPVGEWNSGRIVFDGNHGEHWLNGELVLSYELNSSEMDAAIEGSKWSDIADFGKRHRDSHIILQDHGDMVWYRNMKLRELP